MSSDRDNLYTGPVENLTGFRFDERVVKVFPDMIQRSVPGYSTIVTMTGLLAGRYCQRDSNLYDLGCSLGASTLAMRGEVAATPCRIIGIDNSEAMIERCKELIDRDSGTTPVILRCADLREAEIENASVVVLNFTLQFIEPRYRDDVIAGIYRGMRPGGILLLSEKVSFEDTALDQLNTELHHEFKRQQGYSDLEIARKRNALENVLVRESLQQHKYRVRSAGFSSCEAWFQCFNFASLVAIK